MDSYRVKVKVRVGIRVYAKPVFDFNSKTRDNFWASNLDI